MTTISYQAGPDWQQITEVGSGVGFLLQNLSPKMASTWPLPTASRRPMPRLIMSAPTKA